MTKNTQKEKLYAENGNNIPETVRYQEKRYKMIILWFRINLTFDAN